MKQLGKPGRKFKRAWLNDSQKLGVRHVLESRDRCVVLRGVAGSGKTTLMSEVCEAIAANGNKVVALAPTAEASRGVMRKEGFKDADTVARLLTDPAFQQRAKDSVWWIDEAGLLGAKTTNRIFELAQKLGARLLLTGDKRQNPSVERGSVLHLLETEAGIKPAEVRDIQRQKDQYKDAVKAFSEGKAAKGLEKLDKLGWVHEIKDADERYRQLATDYADTVASGKECLVVCPTHREGERVTAEIRKVLKDRGRLGREAHIVRVLQNASLTEAQRGDAVNYLPSDVIQFHQNAKGYKRGQRITVGDGQVPLGLAKRFTVFRSRSLELSAGDVVRVTHNGWTADGKHRLNNGALYRIKSFDRRGDIILDNNWVVARNFGHLAHGFCVTAYAAQGKTVEHRVLVAQGGLSLPATTKEGLYVACSRAKESVAIYCDDKESLREAVGHSEERLTAMELIRQANAREVVQMHRRQAELHREPELPRQRELVHER
jgi:ATP-dependent exoDNAse (exonuclease V) alpha subunit